MTVCFLQDLENTAGSWDLYGQTDDRRYPGIQAEFFERAAAPLTRRESVYAFVTVGKLPCISGITISFTTFGEMRDRKLGQLGCHVACTLPRIYTVEKFRPS
jgi:hypothetical protein